MKNKSEINSFELNKYIKINPKKKQDFFSLYCFKGNNNEKLRDNKDAGALKANKEYLINNYKSYSKLLIDNGYLVSIEKKLNLKLFPYKIMHVISDEQTRHLIWHRDVYKHNGRDIGPPWPLYKLAIYLQKTDKSNGITGFIPGKFNININNRYADTLYAFLISKFAFHSSVEPGEALLFSGEVMHHRPSSKSKNHRQAIIFSLTTSSEVYNQYKDDITSFPYFYDRSINKI
tara:strand:- start:187 stop:882 length:696 start_codon:yes stop_codon:yes gene_type:complete